MSKLIYAVLLALPGLGSQVALADVRTQDNVNYIVLVNDESQGSLETCVQEIKAISEGQGEGVLQVFERFGIAVVNVTTYGADRISRLECVKSVEPEQTVDANPRVGRGN